MGTVQSIDVFLVDAPSELFDYDLQIWLAQEFDTDAVSVCVDRDTYGRIIDSPFAIVWLYPHPTRTRTNELEGQEAVTAAISNRVGYRVPLWGANPYRSVGATLANQRWEPTGDLTCAVCGKTFEGRTGQSGPRYCPGPNCRQKAWRSRQAPRASRTGA